MTIRISRALLDDILAHAASDPDREVCGLLFGAPTPLPFALSLSKDRSASFEREGRAGHRHAHPERGGGCEAERITAAVPTANVAADPACRFEVDPAALFAAIRAERGGGVRPIGHYHSHPSGDARPSPRDAAMADRPGRLWLIVSGDEALCWRETPGGPVLGAFEPCMLSVEGHCA